MTIHGLYGDEAIERFRSDVHVNIYTADSARHEFFCDADMNSLPEEVIDDPESFFLEPTDDEGIPVPVETALKGRGEADAA